MDEIKCKTCLGCNLLECAQFKGKYECDNYVKANKSGIEMCKEILQGEQLRV